MPAVTTFRATHDVSPPDIPVPSTEALDEDEDGGTLEADIPVFFATTKAEVFDLLLPSSSPCASNGLSPKHLEEMELRLRLGRLEGHLTELRRLLRIRASAFLDKKANSTGQREGTRSHSLLADYLQKIELTTLNYQEERLAALRLDPAGTWQHRLKELDKADVRSAHQNAMDPSAVISTTHGKKVWSEGQREISWIWRVPVDAGSDLASSEAAEVDLGKFWNLPAFLLG
jgi:hypothetical protein